MVHFMAVLIKLREVSAVTGKVPSKPDSTNTPQEKGFTT